MNIINYLKSNFDIVNVNDQCSICIEKVTQAYNIECKHYFHQECLIMWYKEQNSCPLCRKIIIDFSSEITLNQINYYSDDVINVYSFSLYPENFLPSGAVNWSSQ